MSKAAFKNPFDSCEEAEAMLKKTIQSPKPMTPRRMVLNEAERITHHDRNANYGNPEDNFQHIANLWNCYLRVSRPECPLLTPMDVAIMCMQVKVARLGNNPMHWDSIVDIAGYAACAGDIAMSGNVYSTQQQGGPTNSEPITK